MKFESSFTTQEKKLVYQRTLKDLERQLMERLLQEGINPDTFDEKNFTPETEDGRIIHGHKLISDFLSKIDNIKSRIAE
jgi:adenine-specific DNA methylase